LSKNSSRKGEPAASSRAATAASTARTALVSEPRSVLLLWALAALLTWWSFGFTTMLGSDLWWHLASGRWIWTTRTLNFTDPWSFTRFGQPWLSHEWLSDLIFHAWSSLLGMATLVWWKWSVLVGAFLVLFAVLRRLSGSSLAGYLATLLAMAVGAPFFDVRPQLYSVLGFAVLLRLALLPSRFRWLLPIGFFFWVNLHGGFFFGLLALTTILALARLFGAAGRNSLPLWLTCLVVCLLNPSGPDAYVFSLHYALNPKSAYLHVGEWRPLWEPGGIRSMLYYPAIGVFALSAAATFYTGLHRKHARLSFTSLALGLLTLAMSLRSRRFIPLFGMAQGLVLAPVLGVLLAHLGAFLLGRFPWLRRPYPWRLLLPALACGLGVFWLAPYPLSKNAFLYLTSQDSFPVEALNVVEANRLEGKVFSFYEWGGYVDLRSNGRLQVFIDGRADTVFDEEIYRRYTRVLGLAPGWVDIVDASGADYFLWPRRQHRQIQALRDSGKWRTLYSDHVAALLVRTDGPVRGPLRPSPDSAWRELALGWSAAGTNKLPEAEAHFQRALDMMPNLRMACEWLANTQARSNRLDQAETTLNRCQKSFPDPQRRKELLSLFHSRSEETARDPDVVSH
jgi:tetratricopeptide (TPR) repeat protein